MDCDTTMTTVPDSDLETVGTTSVQTVTEAEGSNVNIVTSGSFTQKFLQQT